VTTITAPATTVAVPRSSLARAIEDGAAVTWRNLIAYTRVPQLVVFSTIQPVIFVIMFRYVFGGAIPVKGIKYVDFLMPGIFVQTVTFGAIGTAIGLATDMKSGLLERFRSLPMARSAVLVGRTSADLVRNVFVAILMALVGFLVGFRLHGSWLAFIAAMGLVILFGYVMSWVFATVGLAVGDPETAQAAAFPVLAPLVFASSAFVPVSTMPGWLQVFARHQPVSVTASAARALVLGQPAASYVLQSLGWAVAIVLLFGPLAVARYRRAV
jgi:ABC-2 type transport system permease protein/oleandomycin transport system permease protein